MSEQPEALRLADALDGYATGDKFQRPTEEAAAELRRLYALATDQHSEIYGLNAKVRRLHAEVQEQCRINGMGAERELKLMTEKQELLEALKLIARVNAMDYEYQAWARAAIAKAEGETK